MVACTASEVSIELEPGNWKMPSEQFGWPLSLLSML